jgi:hypothetical protein
MLQLLVRGNERTENGKRLAAERKLIETTSREELENVPDKDLLNVVKANKENPAR